MRKITISILTITVLMVGCKNKTEEVCDCFKKSANTFMIKGEKASESDLMTLCNQYEGALKGADIEEKRIVKDCFDTIKAHIEDKRLFLDVEDVALKPIPCGAEFLKEISNLKSLNERNYYLMKRDMECEIAISDISISNDGEFRVIGEFFDDQEVSGVIAYITLPKDESAQILKRVSKLTIYKDLENDSRKQRELMNTAGLLAHVQILKFKSSNVSINKSPFGGQIIFATATEYSFVKPDPNVHKQQHMGYKDFVFDNVEVKNVEESNVETPKANEQQSDEYIENINEDFDVVKGSWVGDFGKNKLTITINKIGKSGGISGIDKVDNGAEREVSGSIEYNGDNDDNFDIVLNEPGTDKWDGVFTIVYNKTSKKMKGSWKANNGKSKKDFTLGKK